MPQCVWRLGNNFVELSLSFHLYIDSGHLIHVTRPARQLCLPPEPSLLTWRAFKKCLEQLGYNNLIVQLDSYEILIQTIPFPSPSSSFSLPLSFSPFLFPSRPPCLCSFLLFETGFITQLALLVFACSPY